MALVISESLPGRFASNKGCVRVARCVPAAPTYTYRCVPYLLSTVGPLQRHHQVDKCHAGKHVVFGELQEGLDLLQRIGVASI